MSVYREDPSGAETSPSLQKAGHQKDKEQGNKLLLDWNATSKSCDAFSHSQYISFTRLELRQLSSVCLYGCDVLPRPHCHVILVFPPVGEVYFVQRCSYHPRATVL